MSALGRHLLVDLYGCDPRVLGDATAVESLLREVAAAARATVVQECFHRFAPQGVSGIIIIGESHLALHTWPEHGYAAFDLFTCSGDLDTEAAVQCLRTGLRARRHSVSRKDRGVL